MSTDKSSNSNSKPSSNNNSNSNISWDEYFMGLALLSSQRSKDPNSKVGACIVNQDHKIVGIGYNGFPIGINDDELPWGRDGEFLETKYPYVCHAEMNAILNSNQPQPLKNTNLYVTLFPCNECTKFIIQSRIEKIYYLSDKYSDTDSTRAAKLMLDKAGIKYQPCPLSRKNINLSFEPLK